MVKFSYFFKHLFVQNCKSNSATRTLFKIAKVICHVKLSIVDIFHLYMVHFPVFILQFSICTVIMCIWMCIISVFCIPLICNYILTHFALIYYLIYYFSFMLYSSNLIFHIICVSSICIAKCIFLNFFCMICNFALVRIVYYDLFTYDFIKMANI